MIHTSKWPPIHIPATPLAELILGALDRRGDQLAMIDAPTGRTLTCRELAAAIRRVATGLRRRGFVKGQTFGIVLPNVLEYPVAFLATASLGGITTMPNPLCTAEDLTAQLGRARARFVLTIPALLDKVRAASQQAGVEEVFTLGDVPGATPFAALYDPPEPFTVSIDPDDLVALPFSSGTSGRPKAVMLSHRNLVASMHLYATGFPIAEGKVTLAVLPFFHIYGMVLILLTSLWKGQTLVTMQRFELEPFLDTLARYRVNVAPLVPPILVAVTKHPSPQRYDLGALEIVLCGAAPLGADLEAAAAGVLGCRLAQGYGMTEVAGASTLCPDGIPRRGSVGALLPSLESRIVDPGTGRTLGIDERGELWHRGPTVMRGYLEDPAATSATIDADGWLHTGDIAYIDADGYYYIVDRLKELIKYKGHQVAPADLEAVLLTHPGIADAAVIPSPDAEAGEVPKAFVVLRNAELTAEAIMDYVAARVAPSDKVRRVEIVDSIPKSPSGKILRRVLVERERAATLG